VAYNQGALQVPRTAAQAPGIYRRTVAVADLVADLEDNRSGGNEQEQVTALKPTFVPRVLSSSPIRASLPKFGIWGSRGKFTPRTEGEQTANALRLDCTTSSLFTAEIRRRQVTRTHMKYSGECE